ncbi:hypothetical protein [Streptomyces salinarius]|uniref:hypothetical protein n=1 Tax=Streptomyces salinarius TaxID=2762598 RepID=UPI001646C250|nr:hypothetical protein [Streptomyces salinarius]
MAVREVSDERSGEDEGEDAQIERTVHRVTAELTEGTTMRPAASTWAWCRAQGQAPLDR